MCYLFVLSHWLAVACAFLCRRKTGPTSCIPALTAVRGPVGRISCRPPIFIGCFCVAVGIDMMGKRNRTPAYGLVWLVVMVWPLRLELCRFA